MRFTSLAFLALIVMGAPAHADPILTPIIATALTATLGEGAAALTIAGVSISQILAGVVVAGIGIAISLLTAPKPPKPQNGIIPVQQTVPFRIYGYGRAAPPGAQMFKEEANGYLGYVVALNAHFVHRFVGLYLQDDLVTITITSDGFLDGPVSAMGDGRYGGGIITIQTRRGDNVGSAMNQITDHFPSEWPTSARGDGITALSMLCKPVEAKSFTQLFPYGAPAPRPIIEQYIVYDWRDPDQDLNNDATWRYSDNAVLCYAHFRCFSEFGSRKDFAEAILPRIDRWTEAANVCDESRPLKAGGTEPAYRVGGWMTTEQDRKACETTLRSCFDGWTCDLGDGTIDIEAGKYYAPTVTVTDSDILSWSVQRGVASKDRINKMTAKYTSPANTYLVVETDPLNDLDDQAKRDGPPRASQVDLTWVNWTGQASRLLKREFIRQKAARRGTLVLGLSGLNAAYVRRILIQSNTIPGLNNLVVEVTRQSMNIQAQTVTISFVSVGSEIDDYDPAADESTAPPVPTRSASLGPPIPANVNATPVESADGSVVLLVSCDVPVDTNGYNVTTLTYTVQYRLQDDGSGNPGPWIQQTSSAPTVSGGRVIVQTSPVPAGKLLDVEMGSTGGFNAQSGFSAPVTVNTATTGTAPASPTGFTAGGGSGSATLHCTNPNSPNFAGVQFYRSTHGLLFSTAVAVGPVIYGSANGNSDYTDTVGAGSYDYWVVALNGNTPPTGSPPVGPRPATVT
jgi:hypothetical protein